MPQSFEELNKKLTRQQKRMNTEFANKAQIIAFKIERQAKINATTYPRVVTGRLRSSIQGLSRLTNEGPEVIIQAGGKNEVNYARYVEFGTQRIKPRLFIGKAVGTVKATLRTQLRNVLKTVLTE
ncbi:MAG: hypothetical protein CMO80_21940 [Verrucomicrobiales bacterium]|nr:hypothetical protein [Verrucomicrobiales bacterium]|tara:strand:+ start:4306 stop:4680 length:375 start_codon:yes stop_codon:yes gene_type:complete